VLVGRLTFEADRSCFVANVRWPRKSTAQRSFSLVLHQLAFVACPDAAGGELGLLAGSDERYDCRH